MISLSYQNPVLFFILIYLFLTPIYSQKTESKAFGIVIHGGAGTILKKQMTPKKEKAYQEKLQEALEAGYKILQSNGNSLDAVEKAIMILEDSPLFNAGKGAVFTSLGTNELDASIMDGKTLNAGAVAGVQRIKNPIRLARLVMEKSPHVMLSGAGAELFAKEQGIKEVSPKYFFTESRWKQYQEKNSLKKKEFKKQSDQKHGTVGVAALDKHGNLAAGTSTGGMSNKKFGRIGDSPIIGAGTYAANETCAISCTGHGEYFIRLAVAHSISALMKYKKLPLQQAMEEVIQKDLTQLGGKGGVVGIDSKGNIGFSFNTKGMYRGAINTKGEMVIKIYQD